LTGQETSYDLFQGWGAIRHFTVHCIHLKPVRDLQGGRPVK
jgi:hypothetical protein